MTLYRRGSVTVEAIKASEIIEASAWDALPEWVQSARNDGRLTIDADTKLVEVKTIEGWSTADRKSWIVQRQTEHGELYAIPDKRFTDPKAGYTRVE